MAYNWHAIQNQAMQGLRPQQPGIGQKLAQSAGSKLAADQVAKLGLQAAGTAAAGPLGGALGAAAGELAGPLASQAIGSFFNKGGPVYMQWGGNPIFANQDQYAAVMNHLLQTNPQALTQAIGQGTKGEAQANYNKLAQETLDKLYPKQEAQAEAAPKPVVQAPRSKASGSWNIPIGEALGAEWSTQGQYADMDIGKDRWGAGITGTWKFEEGGSVPDKKPSIWDKVKSKISSDYDRRKQLFGKGKPYKPQYKAMGGMTPGPLGMSDLQMLGKPQDISKVMMKKKGGEIEDTVEISYHAPLKYQKPTNTGE